MKVNKKIFNAILAVTLLMFSNVLSAGVIIITCDQNAALLSQQFSQRWSHNTLFPWWSSYADDTMSGIFFVGGMRTSTGILPKDRNPHLVFSYAIANRFDTALFSAICVYHVGNSNMYDQDDGLEMRTQIPANNCFALGPTITCTGT